MPGFELAAVCRAPALDVFTLLHDPARIAEWWAGTDRVETDEAGGVTRYASAWPEFAYPLGVMRGARGVTISCLVSEIEYRWRLAPHRDGCEIRAHVELPDTEAGRVDDQRREVADSLARLIGLAEGRRV